MRIYYQCKDLIETSLSKDSTALNEQLNSLKPKLQSMVVFRKDERGEILERNYHMIFKKCIEILQKRYNDRNRRNRQGRRYSFSDEEMLLFHEFKKYEYLSFDEAQRRGWFDQRENTIQNIYNTYDNKISNINNNLNVNPERLTQRGRSYNRLETDEESPRLKNVTPERKLLR